MAKILAFAGSTRTESLNKKLIRVAVEGARAAGADVTLIDLRDYALPLYDGDLEAQQGLPAKAHELKALFVAHHGLLISSPEYNSSVSGVLKNALDWVSRPVPNEPPLAAYANKVATLMSASPGALGGLRGLVHLRAILGNIKVIVLPEQMALAKAHEAFNGEGALHDAKQQTTAQGLGRGLATFLARLHAGR